MKSTETLKKYREMKDANLLTEIKETQMELTKTLLSVRAGKEDKVSKVFKLKKDLARLKTIILEKRYGVENGK